jgi:hypothetical protein
MVRRHDDGGGELDERPVHRADQADQRRHELDDVHEPVGLAREGRADAVDRLLSDLDLAVPNRDGLTGD